MNAQHSESKTMTSRKQRITRDQARKYAEWRLSDRIIGDAEDMTYPQIQKAFYLDTGINISLTFILEQHGRWIKINDCVYKTSEPWTHPDRILKPAVLL